jgi:hypothetical protein
MAMEPMVQQVTIAAAIIAMLHRMKSSLITGLAEVSRRKRSEAFQELSDPSNNLGRLQ